MRNILLFIELKIVTCNVFHCVLVSVCRFTVFFFLLYWVTTVTPFIERSSMKGVTLFYSFHLTKSKV